MQTMGNLVMIYYFLYEIDRIKTKKIFFDFGEASAKFIFDNFNVFLKKLDFCHVKDLFIFFALDTYTFITFKKYHTSIFIPQINFDLQSKRLFSQYYDYFNIEHKIGFLKKFYELWFKVDCKEFKLKKVKEGIIFDIRA